MPNKIVVKPSRIIGAGRGVFATKDIKKDEIIEICPILIFSKADSELVMTTMLQDYVYAYEQDKTIFVLGYGSLYNHFNAANAKYELLVDDDRPEKDNEMCFTALRDIRRNEEIYINYGKDHFSNTK